jgi:hypothetical protein
MMIEYRYLGLQDRIASSATCSLLCNLIIPASAGFAWVGGCSRGGSGRTGERRCAYQKSKPHCCWVWVTSVPLFSISIDHQLLISRQRLYYLRFFMSVLE